jgi:hypothetical protein
MELALQIGDEGTLSQRPTLAKMAARDTVSKASEVVGFLLVDAASRDSSESRCYCYVPLLTATTTTTAQLTRPYLQISDQMEVIGGMAIGKSDQYWCSIRCFAVLISQQSHLALWAMGMSSQTMEVPMKHDRESRV